MIRSPSGKAYIGKDAHYPSRTHSHRWIAGNEGAIEYASPVHAAIRKYGWNKMELRILERDVTTLAELAIREQKWIAHHKTKLPQGYNQTDGGDGAFGLKHSARSKQKISRGNRGKVRSAEARRMVSLARKGKSLSPEHREKIAKGLEWLKGKSRSVKIRTRIKNGHLVAKGNIAELFGPKGEHKVTNDLRGLAEEFGLQTQHLYHVLNGHRPSHKGWGGYWLERGGDKEAAEIASQPKKIFLSRDEAMRAKRCIHVYEIIAPSGKGVVTDNLSGLCRMNGLDQRKMQQVVKKAYGRKSHMGWTGRILNDAEIEAEGFKRRRNE